MKSLPKNVTAYKKTKVFTHETVPDALTSHHDTKAGTWGVIHVVSGEMDYTIDDERRERETVRLNPQTVGIVEPEIRHFVTPVDEVEFYVEFHR